MTTARTNADLSQNTLSAQQNGGAVAGLKEMIINGRMEISQYNGAASNTPTDGAFPIDRFKAWQSVAGKYSVQQNSGTLFTGFPNYLTVTSLSVYTIAAGDLFGIRQYIEGFNFAQCQFGTASARPVTLTFNVSSSLAGVFGGALYNHNGTRSYPFTYTIAAANTPQRVSILIPGDTSGTWVNGTNALAASVNFSLGIGSTYSGAAGAWASANTPSATGAVSLVGTSGATWSITGVSLKAGDCRNEIYNEWRPYPIEEMLCLRYLPVTAEQYIPGQAYGATPAVHGVKFTVPSRIAPTGILLNTAVGNYNVTTAAFAATPCTALSFNAATTYGGGLTSVIGSSVLTAGNYTTLIMPNGGKILWTGCEL